MIFPFGSSQNDPFLIVIHDTSLVYVTVFVLHYKGSLWPEGYWRWEEKKKKKTHTTNGEWNVLKRIVWWFDSGQNESFKKMKKKQNFIIKLPNFILLFFNGVLGTSLWKVFCEESFSGAFFFGEVY